MGIVAALSAAAIDLIGHITGAVAIDVTIHHLVGASLSMSIPTRDFVYLYGSL